MRTLFYRKKWEEIKVLFNIRTLVSIVCYSFIVSDYNIVWNKTIKFKGILGEENVRLRVLGRMGKEQGIKTLVSIVCYSSIILDFDIVLKLGRKWKELVWTCLILFKSYKRHCLNGLEFSISSDV